MIVLAILGVFGIDAVTRFNILFNGEKAVAIINSVKSEEGILYGVNCRINYNFTNNGIIYFREKESTSIEKSCLLEKDAVVDVIVRPNQPGKAYLVDTAKERFKDTLVRSSIVFLFLAMYLYELFTDSIISFRQLFRIRKRLF